jgi:hypothetical protein
VVVVVVVVVVEALQDASNIAATIISPRHNQVNFFTIFSPSFLLFPTLGHIA